MLDLITEPEWHQARVVVEHTAIAAGAISGCLHAIPRGYDLVGTVVVALTAGLGGGILRDALLGSGPALALRFPSILGVALASAAVGMAFAHRTHHLRPALWLIDALSLGLFTVTGIQRAVEANLDVVPSLFLGVVSGTSGGLLRDVLCRETPTLLLPGRPYAAASLLGGVSYFVFERLFHAGRVTCEAVAAFSCFALRAVSVWRDWTIPRTRDVFHHREPHE